MNKHFNTYILFTMFLVIISGSLFAGEIQNEEQYVQRTKNAYIQCLKNDNNGIVESTLYHIIALKKFYPSADYKHVLKLVKRLSVEGQTASIRYKAYLATMYYTYPSFFSDIDIEKSPEDSAIIFRTIADKLENNLLANN